MNLGVGTLIAAYVCVALLLLILNLRTRWPWPAKAGLIGVVTICQILAYFSLPALLGWPALTAMPKKFNLLSVYIQDPDSLTGAKGKVFFWAVDMGQDAPRIPRAYVVPFTPEFKAKFQEARGKLKKNIPQMGETDSPDDTPFGTPNDKPPTATSSANLRIRDLPRDLPGANAKDAPGTDHP